MQCLSQQYDTRDRPCGNTMHHMSVALRSHSLIVITLAPVVGGKPVRVLVQLQ